MKSVADYLLEELEFHTHLSGKHQHSKIVWRTLTYWILSIWGILAKQSQGYLRFSCNASFGWQATVVSLRNLISQYGKLEPYRTTISDSKAYRGLCPMSWDNELWPTTNSRAKDMQCNTDSTHYLVHATNFTYIFLGSILIDTSFPLLVCNW